MSRPVIGVCTSLVEASWSVWTQRAALTPYGYITAIQRAGGVPVVFVYVSNGVIAGAGKSRADHLPNVTGVEFTSPYGPMLALIRRLMPSARTLGTLFVPSEVNSVFMKDELVKSGKIAGFEVIAVAASTSSEWRRVRPIWFWNRTGAVTL